MRDIWQIGLIESIERLNRNTVSAPITGWAVLGASQQVGTGEHSATEVSHNVSQDPAIGSDGFGAKAANGKPRIAAQAPPP